TACARSDRAASGAPARRFWRYRDRRPREPSEAMAGTAPTDTAPDPAAHRLSLEEARRIAVGAQLLDAQRPTSLLAVVERLTFLQLDPTAAIAPSADLVAWSRLGSAYDPAELRAALDQDRTLYEHDAMVRPMADLRLHLADMAAWPAHAAPRDWLESNASFRADVLAL